MEHNVWGIVYRSLCTLANTIHSGPRIGVPTDSDCVIKVDPVIAVHRAAATAPRQAGLAITTIDWCRQVERVIFTFLCGASSVTFVRSISTDIAQIEEDGLKSNLH